MFNKRHKTIIFLASLIVMMFFAGNAFAVNFGESVAFNVDKDYDASGRNQLASTLIKSTKSLYFYVEKQWWDSQPQAKQDEVLAHLTALGLEFENNIYPNLTSIFGTEWRPGVDGDSRITVLFHSMNSSEGGYFREVDEYIKLQVPVSNEREMLYLSLDNIDKPFLKNLLAHEFMHLITFNQKNRIFGAEEDVWLNEARADYTSTVLGYDDNYEGSTLQQRVKAFIEKPSDSITEWQGVKYDYASSSLFMHYMVDHYGINILIDSLKSKKTGVGSLNYALGNLGYKEDFGDIFTNWTIASLLNDCSINEKYCYLNKNLKKFKVAPSLNFLPFTGNASLSVANVTKNWTGNWLKFIGGNGDLKLEFSTLKGLKFQVPYVVEDSAGSYSVKLLTFNASAKGEIEVKNFGSDFKSLILLPSLQSNIYKMDGVEPTYPFSYTVSVTDSSTVAEDQDLIERLLDRIASLKQEIAKLLAQKDNPNAQNFCNSLDFDLRFGMSGNEVSCLQEFLKNQGTDIYPEGLVTGNFGSLTRAAVIRFQQKYASEVLKPVGLSAGTGYVGSKTRMKINQILSGR